MKYHAGNIVSSFFYYIWNTWNKEKCRIVFGGDYLHFWEKRNVQVENPIYGATERFYTELSEHSRTLLVECAVSLYDGKTFRKEPDDSKVLVCERYGLGQVETQARVDANIEMYICDTARDCDGEQREECEENADFCSLEEFRQIMQSWWTGNGIRTLEGIVGLKETDYLSNNNSQAFAGATGEWWYNLDYDGKRDVYNRYTPNNE